MKVIRGKKAYWGRFTFEATEDTIDDKTVTRLDIYLNCPRKFESTYFFKTKKQLIDLSNDKDSAFGLYAGSLSGKRFERVKSKRDGDPRYGANKVISILSVDVFLNSFRTKI